MNRKNSSKSTLHRMITKEKQRVISTLRECSAGAERNEHLNEHLNCVSENLSENLNCVIEESVPLNEIEDELPNESNTTNYIGENSFTASQQEINYLKYIIQKQNEFILEELAEIKVIVRQLQREKRTNDTIMKLFPLKSKTSLEEFERDINNFDEDDVIVAIQKIVGIGGLSKRLHNLLDKEIILKFNYDGMQGKEAFKAFATVNNIFYKAVEKDVGTRDNYIKELKKGFRLSKNKFHKKKCLDNKKSKE